jgi:hypothetical protein
MRFFLQSLVIVTVWIILSGCERQPLTRMSLFQHPQVLQEQLAHCQTSERSGCVLVKSVSQEFLVLKSQRQENPELFGKMILQAQQEQGKIEADLEAAKNELSVHAGDAVLQKKVATLTQNYSAQSEKIATMLAVVASTSPE